MSKTHSPLRRIVTPPPRVFTVTFKSSINWGLGNLIAVVVVWRYGWEALKTGQIIKYFWESDNLSFLYQQLDSSGWQSCAIEFSIVILWPRLITPSSRSSAFVNSGRWIPRMSFSSNAVLYWAMPMDSSQSHTFLQVHVNNGLSLTELMMLFLLKKISILLNTVRLKVTN